MDNSLTINSPMSHTQMTQHTEMSHLFVDPDQSKTIFWLGQKTCKNFLLYSITYKNKEPILLKFSFSSSCFFNFALISSRSARSFFIAASSASFSLSFFPRSISSFFSKTSVFSSRAGNLICGGCCVGCLEDCGAVVDAADGVNTGAFAGLGFGFGNAISWAIS